VRDGTSPVCINCARAGLGMKKDVRIEFMYLDEMMRKDNKFLLYPKKFLPS